VCNVLIKLFYFKLTKIPLLDCDVLIISSERKRSTGLDITKRSSNSNSVFANLDRVVKKAREERSGVPAYSNKPTGNVHDRASDKYGLFFSILI